MPTNKRVAEAWSEGVSVGYQQALKDVYERLTQGEGRTESYEDAVRYIEENIRER